jgi:autotransporter-associated beta strand protein
MIRGPFIRPWVAALVCIAAFSGSVDPARAANSTWSLNNTGTFSVAGNWNAGVPGASAGTTNTDLATFQRSVITTSRTVVFDASTNLGGVLFDNNSAGTNVFSLTGTAGGAATSGTLTLSSGWLIANSGTGTGSGANLIDVATVLMGSGTVRNDFGSSVFNLGVSAGSSANVITTGSNLGAIDLVLSGSSTGSNLQAMRINQAVGTTLRLVKDGPGFWQLNGPSSGASGLTGGFLMRSGAVSIGRSSGASLGTGPVVIGDADSPAGDLRMAFGSSVTMSNNVTIAASPAANVIIERGGGSGGGTLSGTVTLARDLTLRQGTAATQTLALSAASLVTGAGNLIIGGTFASPGAINLQGRVNMTGTLSNQSTNATGVVTVSGTIGSNVTGLVQNSLRSRMVLQSANTYAGPTVIRSGTLALDVNGGFASSPSIIVGDAGSSGAVLDLTAKTGTFSFGAGQTVGGIGTVNIGAGKTVSSVGIWAPGNSIGSNTVTGNLTLSGTSLFELGTPGSSTTSPGSSDFTSVSEGLILGGNLTLLDNAGANSQGSYGAGSYRLFTAPTLTGTFATVTAPAGATTTRVAMVYTAGTASGQGVFANVYNLAAANAISGTIDFGTVLAGTPLSQSVSIVNTAPVGSFTENLDAAFGALTGNATTNSGSVSLLAAGGTSAAMSVGLDSAVAGGKSGSVRVDFASNGDGTSGLGVLSLAAQTVSLTGTVLDPASPSWTSGSASAASLLIDLGEHHQSIGTFGQGFSIWNLVQTAGYTANLDLLTITSGTANSAAITTDLATFAGLASGSSNGFNASLALDTAGIFTNTYTLAFRSSSGGAQFNDTPQDLTLTVTGAVIVPEPSAIALGGLGIAGAGWSAWRRRRVINRR